MAPSRGGAAPDVVGDPLEEMVCEAKNPRQLGEAANGELLEVEESAGGEPGVA